MYAWLCIIIPIFLSLQWLALWVYVVLLYASMIIIKIIRDDEQRRIIEDYFVILTNNELWFNA